MKATTSYLQLTRVDGSFLQVPYHILINARILSGPAQPGTFLYYENGGYDHIQETPEKIDMAICAFTAGALRDVERPTGPIGVNLDFLRALALVNENPQLRCLVSHRWAVMGGRLYKLAIVDRTMDHALSMWNGINGEDWERAPLSELDTDAFLGLWDVYYTPKEHPHITPVDRGAPQFK